MKLKSTQPLIALGLLAVLVVTPIAISAHPKPKAELKSFAVFFSEPKSAFADRTNAKSAAYWKTWTEYIGGIQQSGKMESGSALQLPSTGVWIDKKGKATDEKGTVHLSGYLVLKAESIDEVIAIAERSPAIAEGGAVQVRPILPMDQHKAGL